MEDVNHEEDILLPFVETNEMLAQIRLFLPGIIFLFSVM